ncbi:MAG: SUMF1/EgtB/PvdO family nonheme iron enzyme [Desulfococcaceae bacterium]|jgi:formylglycine-generating enzyme required for sulfatase activity|nr:SUMF1/EgtB/PvdO family nonheme iron enzyme [Desulfococcaceae bacterium]
MKKADTEPAQILHLSDLHFGTAEDAKIWYSQLADDLKNELDCQRLDALILSGDIANFSVKEEYEAAEIFIRSLCEKFRMSPSALVMVPGNHDLNWGKSEDSYELKFRKDCEGELKDGNFIAETDKIVQIRNEEKYRERFAFFREFCRSLTEKDYPSDYGEQGLICHLPEINILIAGFNSAWNLDHHFRSRASISNEAVTHVLDEIRDNGIYKDCLKFAVWHHPLHSPFDDRITDHGFMQRLAVDGFRVCFHGHIHKSDAGLYLYDQERKIHIVGAGTFGAPVKEWTPGYPLQYNLLRIKEKRMIVETRRRIEINGAWKPDAVWTQGGGKDPLLRYEIELPGREDVEKPRKPGKRIPVPDEVPKPDEAFEKTIRAYCRKAASLHEALPLAGFKTRIKVPIRIEDIYIPLHAMLDRSLFGDNCYSDAADAKIKMESCGGGDEISLPDAFVKSEGKKRTGIVILGDPGSGKTTHLKRLLLYCVREGPEKLGLPPDMIPVFLPLRELGDTENGLKVFIQEQLDKSYLDTPKGFGKRLMERGKLLFLLDGLDEVPEAAYRAKVSRWIEDHRRVNQTCRFVVTSRFAGYTPEAQLDESFLVMHILPLNEEKAGQFIHNWYRIVEGELLTDAAQARILAGEKAGELIARLSEPDFRSRKVFFMTRNPLLLANLCLVHRARGNLPHTRALLYEECIDVLLERWRAGAGIQTRISAQTGRKVLQPAAYWMHQEEERTRATASELAPVIDPVLKRVGWSHGSGAEFLKAVRDESGLLTGWDQEHYGFMHLGFQEYLAAREIQNRVLEDDSVLAELAAHFGESWWQEVILLMLALENPPLFKKFMREVLKQPGFPDYSKVMEMCLEDACETSVQPFLELLAEEAGEDAEKWERQFAALRIAERLDASVIENLLPRLREHPHEKIRNWVRERLAQELQDVKTAKRGGYELVRIPGGTFMMGSPENEEGRDDDEGPVHEVRIPDFYMGRYPVTNEEYGRFLAENPDAKEPAHWGDRKFNQPRQPVVGVNWHEAKKYADWAGLQLPSEAQWEYACRAGTDTRYYTGNNESDLKRAGWYGEDWSEGSTHPVGEKECNSFGLYDMHGNVWEWMEDDWHDNYEGAPDDGSAWVDEPRDSERVLRGGSWGIGAVLCRTACRCRLEPDGRSGLNGFRLVLRLPGQQ